MQNIIGIRELSNQISRIVRLVREERTEYIITVRGKPVAVLRPFTDEDVQQLHQEQHAHRRLLEFLDRVQTKLPDVSEAEAEEDIAEAIRAVRATK